MVLLGNINAIPFKRRKAGIPFEPFDPASFNEAWTVTGKTNEDSDRTTIVNLTGNGNNLVLSNFLFAGNSGYGFYNTKKFDNWSYFPERANVIKNGFSITVTNSIITASPTNYNADFLYTITNPGVNIFKVTGLINGQKIFLGRKNSTEAYVVDKDGLYRSDYSIPAEGGKVTVGIGTVGFTGECNITIEQIPDYEGYLVTDGVDDKVDSNSFSLGKNWTVVGDWKFIVKENKNSGAARINKFYFCNRTTGIRFYINSTTTSTLLEINKVLAVSSDGSVYDENWNVHKIDTGNIETNSGKIQIGCNGPNFTQVAFKNLGIYNNRILSKDQCIQAYNYLQLQKAK